MDVIKKIEIVQAIKIVFITLLGTILLAISAKTKIPFENLTPLFPQQRLSMELGNGSTEDITTRIIDLASPTGKGQRGLIVSPPKAGKTIILQNIAHAISINYPRALAKATLSDSSATLTPAILTSVELFITPPTSNI